MKQYIRVIIKQPGEPGMEMMIENSLKELQRIVGGYIQVIQPMQHLAVIVNEEGKLMDLPPNIFYGGDLLVGTIIFVGVDGEDFTDVPITWDMWKRLILREE